MAARGKNDMEHLIMSKGAGEKWGDLIGRFLGMIERLETNDIAFRPDLSYMPEQ